MEDNIDNITALHALFDHKIPTRTPSSVSRFQTRNVTTWINNE